MDLDTLEIPVALSRSKRIKQATSAAHDRLDQTIMGYEPFADLGRYHLFLQMQYRFHGCLQPIYKGIPRDPRLSTFECIYRLSLIEQDLADLGVRPDHHATLPLASPALSDLPRALGWLYVAEGSNLGAAFLLKEAASLGLTPAFGARHLAAPSEGRGAYWRNFTAALDALDLPQADEDLVIDGAREAFTCVRSLVEHYFGRN